MLGDPVAWTNSQSLSRVASDLPQIKRKRFTQRKLYSLSLETDFTRHAPNRNPKVGNPGNVDTITRISSLGTVTGQASDWTPIHLQKADFSSKPDLAPRTLYDGKGSAGDAAHISYGLYREFAASPRGRKTMLDNQSHPFRKPWPSTGLCTRSRHAKALYRKFSRPCHATNQACEQRVEFRSFGDRHGAI